MTRTQIWKRWRRWALVLGIFALGIPASAGFLVRSTASRQRLHDLATEALREELGLRATIGSVQLQLVPFSLVARDITLDDPVYGRTAQAQELRIRPSFRALLRGGLDLQGIEVHQADLRLVVRNGQVRNLPRADGGGGGGPPTLPFAELIVRDSTLTVDAEPHASGQLRHVDLDVRGIDGGISVSARSRDGWVRHRGGRETLQLLDGRVRVFESSIEVPSLALRTPELQVSVNDGVIPLAFEDHGYRGRLEVAYDLSHIERLPLPQGAQVPPLRGQVRVAADLRSEGEVQRADGELDLSGVHIEQWGIGDTVHVRFSADRRRVRILEGSVARLPDDGGAVALGGSLSLDPERGFPLDVTAGLQDMSFARLMKMLGVTDDAIVEWMFDGQLGLAGTLIPLDLDGAVDVDTRDFMVTHGPYHARPVRRVIGVSRAGFEGRWSIRPDAVRFYDLVGDLPRSRLRGDVHLGFDNRLGVRAEASVVDLRDLTPLDRFAMAGVGTARCEIEGSFQAPRVTGHVQLADFLFDEFRLGDVHSDAELDPDGLGVRFAMVHADKGDSRYRAEDLYLDFHHDRFAMSGLVHLDSMLLADFYRVFGLEEDERFSSYQGLARGSAEVRYTNGFPGDAPSGTLDVGMDLRLPWASLDDYRFEDGELDGHFRWLDWSRGIQGAELAISHLSLRKGEGTVTVDGRMEQGGALDMNAVADRIALSEVEGIGDRFEGLDGVLTAIGRVGGTTELMRAELDVGLTNVTYDGRSFGDGRFYVRHTDEGDPWVAEARRWERSEPPDEPCAHARDGLAHADWPADPPIRTIDGPRPRLTRPMAFLVCGSGLDDRLRVDLAVGRTEALPVRGIIQLDELDLAPLLPRTPDGEPFRGTISGTLALEDGAIRRPETLQGSLSLSDVRVGPSELQIRNHRPVQLAFDEGVLSVQRARFVGPDSRLQVRGRAALEDGLALRVDGELDLSLVSRLTRTVTQGAGQMSVRVNVSGPLMAPELYGTAQVQGGSFRFASFDPVVENLQGRVRFSQRSVLFEGFGADVAGGHVDLSGSAQLLEQGIDRYQFDVRARDLSYDFAEGVDASFGALAQLTWSRGERLPTLRGEVRMSRFRYTRPIELRSLGDMAANMVRGAFRRQRAEVRRYDPEQDMVRLDLRVVQGAPFQIRNNLIDAQVRIQDEDQPFRIVGTDQRYGIRGAVQISNGRIFFQNNEFDVRRGTIQFDDSTRIDPHVDVEAVTEVRRTSDLSAPNWRVMLHLMGSSDNLRLRTRSDPELPEPDILMLLAFGMTRSELQQLQQGGDLASAAALEAITSVTGVDREVRRALPLIDDIRLTTGYSYRTGRSEPRLSVGKRIAERVRLSATTGLGEGREFRGALEWQLDDNMRVGVSYDNYNINGANSFGNLGVDWGYRLEFE